MPYAVRNAAGQLASLHREPLADATFLPDDHPEVLGFLGGVPTQQTSFDRLDADFVRVLEDVIDTLIVKNVLNLTDLPEQAQAKLLARKSFRERASKSALQLFDRPTDFGDVI